VKKQNALFPPFLDSGFIEVYSFSKFLLYFTNFFLLMLEFGSGLIKMSMWFISSDFCFFFPLKFGKKKQKYVVAKRVVLFKEKNKVFLK